MLNKDDFSQLKSENINCLLICGAASHLTLKDYQYFLSFLAEDGYIAFNLLCDPNDQNRRNILPWMNEYYERLDNHIYTHRRLLGASSVNHEIFLYRNKKGAIATYDKHH